MAKALRFYEPIWIKLKSASIDADGNTKVGVIQVVVTNSNEAAVQKRLIRTLRKAMQKEKYSDVDFRSLYPDSTISSSILLDGKSLEFRLERGMRSGTTQSLLTIFGG
jgi:hypothetical protein